MNEAMHMVPRSMSGTKYLQKNVMFTNNYRVSICDSHHCETPKLTKEADAVVLNRTGSIVYVGATQQDYFKQFHKMWS